MLKKNLDKSKKSKDNPFIEVQKRFSEWIESRPTGKFSVEVNVNQGGIRDKLKIIISEKITSQKNIT